MMRRLVRLVLFLMICLATLAACATLRLVLSGADEAVRMRWQIRLTQWWARALLALLALRVNAEELQQPFGTQGTLFVSNHQSYLDTLVIAAHCPTLFVAKSEVSRWPLLGWLASLGGTIFIQRDCPHSNVQAFYQVCRALRQGTNVVVFPEGTTTNGTRVLRFHPFFFAAAARTATPIQPLALRYLAINEKPLDHETRDALCWYGEMDFVRHFWRLLHLPSAEAVLLALPPLEPHLEPYVARSLASQAKARIAAAYAAATYQFTHERKPIWLDAMKTNALIALKRWN